MEADPPTVSIRHTFNGFSFYHCCHMLSDTADYGYRRRLVKLSFYLVEFGRGSSPEKNYWNFALKLRILVFSEQQSYTHANIMFITAWSSRPNSQYTTYVYTQKSLLPKITRSYRGRAAVPSASPGSATGPMCHFPTEFCENRLSSF